jgi:hypothetical protein
VSWCPWCSGVREGDARGTPPPVAKATRGPQSLRGAVLFGVLCRTTEHDISGVRRSMTYSRLRR